MGLQVHQDTRPQKLNSFLMHLEHMGCNAKTEHTSHITAASDQLTCDTCDWDSTRTDALATMTNAVCPAVASMTLAVLAHSVARMPIGAMASQASLKASLKGSDSPKSDNRVPELGGKDRIHDSSQAVFSICIMPGLDISWPVCTQIISISVILAVLAVQNDRGSMD